MSRRVFTTCLLACAPSAGLAPAGRGEQEFSRHQVRPLDVAIGETLTITGRGFVPGKLKNTVVFQHDD